MLLERLELGDLELGPSQVWGSVRLAPVLRRTCPGDLRLASQRIESFQLVKALDPPGSYYCAYVPHALVAGWTEDGSPVASLGTSLGEPPLLHRIRQRTAKNELTFLPLHLALDGFMALHFKGPDIAWQSYRREVRREGLGIRWEVTVPGWTIRGLEEALARFEIQADQVGLLLFVDEALASAFVVSHPDDYRKLHRSLLRDFYCETLLYYGYLRAQDDQVRLDETRVGNLSDLKTELERVRQQHQELHQLRANFLLDRELSSRLVYRAGPFELQSFMTDLNLDFENHVGEAIVNGQGGLEYLRTYRLTEAQTRRAFLLTKLAESEWGIEAAGKALGCEPGEVVRRLVRAGFDYLLNPEVVQKHS